MDVEGDALEALLVRSADGDRDAFARFYDLTSVRAYALARLADPSGPEDLMRRSYVRAWRTAGRRGPDRPVAWLLATVQQTSRQPRSPSPTG